MLDIIIILFLGFGGLIGYKQGFTKALVNLLGVVAVIILSFILKNPVAEFMMIHFPFFDFYGLIKGISALNILVYEVMAFGLCFSILFIVLKVLMMVTGIFEKILSMTIILGIPSKILGFICGILKNYIIAFVVLVVLSLPNFNDNKIINESNLREPILNTPILNGFIGEASTVFNEFASLKDEYVSDKDSNKFNYDALDLFLKYDVVKVDIIQKLVQNDKLHINGSKELIEKYKES